MEEIRRRLKQLGLGMSRSRLYTILRNPVHIGSNRISAWRNEPEHEIQRLFDPIVEPSLFERVQQVRFGKKRHSGYSPSRTFSSACRSYGWRHSGRTELRFAFDVIHMILPEKVAYDDGAVRTAFS